MRLADHLFAGSIGTLQPKNSGLNSCKSVIIRLPEICLPRTQQVERQFPSSHCSRSHSCFSLASKQFF